MRKIRYDENVWPAAHIFRDTHLTNSLPAGQDPDLAPPPQKKPDKKLSGSIPQKKTDLDPSIRRR